MTKIGSGQGKTCVMSTLKDLADVLRQSSCRFATTGAGLVK